MKAMYNAQNLVELAKKYEEMKAKKAPTRDKIMKWWLKCQNSLHFEQVCI